MQNESDNFVGGMKIRSEQIGFEPGQMAACPQCGKANAPDRANCLYCASSIRVAEQTAPSVKINLRPLENWESGYNLVYQPPSASADTDLIARFLKLEPEHLDRMLSAEFAFPIARLESENDAKIAQNAFGEAGLQSSVVSDVSLKVGKPNIRLRSVGFPDGALELLSFNTGEKLVVPADEIVLLVVGRVTESKTESVAKGKKTDRKILDESSSFSDDLLIDIYSKGPGEAGAIGSGWRISTKGFDFSGLGQQKGLLAAENIQRILKRLKETAVVARIVEEYDNIQDALSMVWTPDSQKDFEGMKRTGVWKSGFSNVVTTSNLNQFSKYSRLQRILL